MKPFLLLTLLAVLLAGCGGEEFPIDNIDYEVTIHRQMIDDVEYVITKTVGRDVLFFSNHHYDVKYNGERLKWELTRRSRDYIWNNQGIIVLGEIVSSVCDTICYERKECGE